VRSRRYAEPSIRARNIASHGQQQLAPSLPRATLPFELVRAIAREAWLDVSLWDHAPLYIALVSTHPYLYETMPALGWAYVFCRSPRDFGLYLRLCTGTHLSAEQKAVAHVELHVSCDFLVSYSSLLGDRACMIHMVATGLAVFPHDGKLFRAAARTAVYGSTPYTSFDLDSQGYTLGLHALCAPSALWLVSVNCSSISRWRRLGSPAPVWWSVTTLTVITRRSQRPDWARYSPAFGHAFPAVRKFTLRGPPTAIGPLLPLLPSHLEVLALEISPAPGTLQAWGLLPALKAGFEVGDEERSPRVVLLTGPGEPEGLGEALDAAAAQGVHMERSVEHRPLCAASATFRPLTYDLNAALAEVKI
jgi:hypothetical protein